MEESIYNSDSHAGKRAMVRHIAEIVSRPIEALTGKAYYEAISKLEGHEEAVDTAISTNSYDMDEVLSVIEKAGTEPDMYKEMLVPYWQEGRIEP